MTIKCGHNIFLGALLGICVLLLGCTTSSISQDRQQVASSSTTALPETRDETDIQGDAERQGDGDGQVKTNTQGDSEVQGDNSLIDTNVALNDETANIVETPKYRELLAIPDWVRLEGVARPDLLDEDAPTDEIIAISKECYLNNKGLLYCRTKNVQGRFTAVSSASRHSCGIQIDNQVKCWLNTSLNSTFVEPDTSNDLLRSVSAGYEFHLGEHACGILLDNSVKCWGTPICALDEADRTLQGESLECIETEVYRKYPPAGKFKIVATGGKHACGVRVDGIVECWGSNNGSPWEGGLAVGGQAEPPEGLFEMVGADESHTCGLRVDGTVECWGWYADRNLSPPSGRFAAISVDGGTCGLRLDRIAECWGGNPLWPNSAEGVVVPGGPFVAISGEATAGCGLREEGRLTCWGEYLPAECPTAKMHSLEPMYYSDLRNVRMETQEPSSDSTQNKYSASQITIGIKDRNNLVSRSAEADFLSAVDAGNSTLQSQHYSLLRPPRIVGYEGPYPYRKCSDWWGEFLRLPPAEEYVELSVSQVGQFACGIRAEGEVECWGPYNVSALIVSIERFTSLAAGWDHICGIKQGGEAECWGGMASQFSCDEKEGRVEFSEEFPCRAYSWKTWGELSPPEGVFIELVAGHKFSCGLRPGGEAECWGIDNFSVSSPPAGRFTRLDAGPYHVCGLRPDGEAECWGADIHGVAFPVKEVFESLSTGAFHTCGLRRDKTAFCWGENRKVTSSTPEGQFEELTSSIYRTCGVRLGGEVECWGGINEELKEFADKLSNSDDGCDASTTFPCYLPSWYEYGSPLSHEVLSDRFISIAVGHEYSCGILLDKSVTCW